VEEIRITLSVNDRCLAEDILEFVCNVREEYTVIVGWRGEEGDEEVRCGEE
jgi:hypothetical protein